MKETRLLCDFCGKPITFIDYDYQPNYRIKMQRYMYAKHRDKKWRNIDICTSCQHIIHDLCIKNKKKWNEEN